MKLLLELDEQDALRIARTLFECSHAELKRAAHYKASQGMFAATLQMLAQSHEDEADKMHALRSKVLALLHA